jgi:hypothetical protein
MDAQATRAPDALLAVREEVRRGRRSGEAQAARRAEESPLTENAARKRRSRRVAMVSALGPKLDTWIELFQR